MTDIEIHEGFNGEPIKLGWIPPSDDGLLMRAATTSITAYRTAKGLPATIPQSEWVEVDFISPLGNRCINNQQQCGGCSGWSAAQASARERIMRGMPFLKLSGAAVYAQVNGGRDNGSNIIDTMNCLETTGTCLESEMDYPNIYPNQIPPGVLRFKEAAPKVTVDTFAECATALMMNMLPQFPLNATSRWTSNTGYSAIGVADLSSSRSSNHSVHGAGLVNISGTWYIILPNSWALAWGPFAKQNPSWYSAFIARNNITPLDPLPLRGCVLISEAHIDNTERSDDGYSHCIPTDPTDTVPTPGVA